MPTQVIMRAARAHCYKCGSTKIAQVCHHCGAAICDIHIGVPSELRRWLLRPEFDLRSLPAALRGHLPAHCGNCAHLVGAPSQAVLGSGVALALVGGALVWQRVSLAALALLLLGLAIAVATSVLGWRWRTAARRPPLPLLPRIGVVKLRETVAATVVLDHDGKYQIDQLPTAGELELSATLQRSERERLEQYRKYYRLAPGQAVTYHAGFLVLQEKAALRFTGLARADVAAPNILALTGDASTLPLLSSMSTRESDIFSYKSSYQVCETIKPMPLPLTLVPSFIQESDKQALDLELQWVGPRQWNAAPLELDRLVLLRVDVPAIWGEIEWVGGGALIAPPENGLRRIEWRQLLPSPNAVGARSWRFPLRFDSQIDQSDVIRGRAEVQFYGALSAISDVKLFYPFGTPSKGDPCKISTTVAVDFELSLAGVRYQDTRVVPDVKRPEDRARAASKIYEGVVPDYATVIALTNELSRRPLYIKRTIENPPRVGEHVSLRNRYWDIAGRSYDGVYPIDVHIVVSGEEVQGGSLLAQGGTSRITLTVQGAYVNADMENKIVQLWDELHAQIDSIMHARPRTRSAAQASAEDAAAQASAIGIAGIDQARARLHRLLQTMHDEQVSTVRIYQELVQLSQDIDQVASAAQNLRQAEVGA